MMNISDKSITAKIELSKNWGYNNLREDVSEVGIKQTPFVGKYGNEILKF